jgi:hypothetical protein
MLTVQVEDSIASQIAHLAEAEARTTEEVVHEALARYLSDAHRTLIRAETEAFEQLLPTLKTNHAGDYVAIHQGKVLDHDPDLRNLHLRVVQRLGNVPVLLKKVSDEPDRDLVFRSPRIERQG